MAEKWTNGVSPSEESGGVNGLTPIHNRIHCAATKDSLKPDDENELEGIAVDHFLDTLAEVALAIARRREQLNQ